MVDAFLLHAGSQVNRDSIHAERGLDMRGARDHLIERLLDGYSVNGLRISDLLDSDIDQGLLSTKDAAAMLCAAAAPGRTKLQEVDAVARIEKTLRAAAERYINGKPELVREQAEQDALEEQA